LIQTADGLATNKRVPYAAIRSKACDSKPSELSVGSKYLPNNPKQDRRCSLGRLRMNGISPLVVSLSNHSNWLLI
jgi:hypothetical protein